MKIGKDKVRFYYGIFLTVFTIAVGVLLVAETASVYYGADVSPYLSPSLHTKSTVVLVVFLVWLAAVIGGFVLTFFFPESGKGKPYVDHTYTLRRLKARTPDCGEEDFLAAEERANKWDKTRMLLAIVAGAILLLCAAMCVVRLAVGIDRSGNAVQEVLVLLKDMLPWLACALVSALVLTAVDCFALSAALRSRKELLVLGRGFPVRERKKGWYENEKTRFWTVTGARIAVAVLAVSFIVFGIVNGETPGVLAKAINVCLECIGIG